MKIVALILALFLAPVFAQEANDMRFQQRKPSNLGDDDRWVPFQVADCVLRLNATTVRPDCLPVSDLSSSARSSISLTTTGASGPATYNSGTGVLNVPQYTYTPASRSFSYTTRALNTCFQPSASRDTFVTYAVDIQTSLSLTTGQQGTVYLETFTNSGCSTGTQELARFVNGQTGTLTIGLALTQNVTGTLTGIVPSGLWARLRTENNVGSPVFTARPGQEVGL